MLRSTRVARGYENWPWPAKLPLSGHWFSHLPTKSISKDLRGVQRFADFLTVGLVGFIGYRAWDLYASGAYQTRLKHLNGTAPAIVAQNFDFQSPNPRHVPRAELDKYREDYAAAKVAGQTVESIIFKY